MHKILVYLRLIIVCLSKSSTCFEHYSAHIQEVYVVLVYLQPLVSSLSAGECLVHRLRENSFELYPAHLQEVYVVIVYMQPLVSSLSAGECLVHRLREDSLKHICLTFRVDDLFNFFCSHEAVCVS